VVSGERGAIRISGVVIDASVALKLLLPEAHSEAVRARWIRWAEQDTEILAPFLLTYEVTSVLRNKVHRGELPAEAGDAAFEAFTGQPIVFRHPPGLGERAWALAKQFNLATAYDATYLALAELADYVLWTADRRFAAALGRRTTRVRVVAP
jgi:predicted nucleic acid-binding protein